MNRISKTPQLGSFEGERCSSKYRFTLEMVSVIVGLIASRLFKKSDKDMLMQYTLGLYKPWMRFFQFANRVCGPREFNVLITVLKSVITKLTSSLDLAEF